MRTRPTITTSFTGLLTENAMDQLLKIFPAGWVVYILECADGSLYTGVSNDLVKRLRTHMSGHGAKYTRSHEPQRLVYVEPRHTRADAQQREAAIKQLPRELKLRLIGSWSAVANLL